jgi:hypothetical protein
MLHQEKVEEFSELYNKHRFIVYFLYNGEDQNVHVEEAEEVDFFGIVKHLDFGGSVFITHRTVPARLESLLYDEESGEVICE